MAETSRGPYREKALERLSSPERLDQLLRVVDQKSWLPLVTMGVLLLILLGWSVLGRIPVNVHGKGILTRPRQIVEFQSPGSGYLARLHARVDAVVEVGDVLAEIARPDLEKQLELLRAEAHELTALSRAAEVLGLRGRGVQRAPATIGAELEGHFAESRDLAGRLLARERRSIEEERERLGEQLRLARALSDSLSSRLEGQRLLHESGIVSALEVDDAEAQHVDGLARVSSLESQLRHLDTKELEVNDQYFTRLERVADLMLDMQEYEQQVAEVDREIARLELRLRQEARIVSEHRGRILEISAAAGQFLAPGERLGAIATGGPAGPLESLTFFTVKDGKRLKPGQTIRVTPDTVERQRYGSIVGTIRRVSTFPGTLAEAERIIGNREVAETLISGGFRMQVFAELALDPATPTGYRWSTSRGPEIEITAGTTTTARVAVERRSPITFVFPFLKSILGVD